MVVSSAFLLALGAAALASALYLLIGATGPWTWRPFFALTIALTIILFVLLTGGAIRIG
jgi:hypothetical protein